MAGKIICAVVIAHCPDNSAGNTWAFLNWIQGFKECGWDVWMVEHLSRADLAYEPGEETSGPSKNEKLWNEVVTRCGLQNRATLFLDDEAPNAGEFAHFAADADVFLNISGQFKLHDRVRHIPRRVYLDIDPGFSQLWATVWNIDMNFEAHTDFFTVGACLRDARIPKTGHDWKPVYMPVHIPSWTTAPEAPAFPPGSDPTGAWTTVTHWYGYNAVEWEGTIYGPKRDSLLKVRELPSMVNNPLAIVTDLKREWGDDYDEFTGAGWCLISPERICSDLDLYRRFLAASSGEFSVAKDGYVVSGSGWFSDRSACYLALGRPVVLQETAWTRVLPSGDGLLPWSTPEEAAQAIKAVESNPSHHAAAARQIAEQHLSTKVVIPRFMEQLL